MKARGSDRLLNWGFALALTLHAAALAGAACLPAHVAKDELSEIRVFDADAPLMVPVELVEIPAPAPEVEEPVVVLPTPPPPHPPTPKPAVEKPAVEEPVVEKPAIEKPPRPVPAVEKPPAPEPVARPKPLLPVQLPLVPAVEPPRPVTPSTQPVAAGGGGGGGAVDLGTPAAGGDVEPPSGGTPMGGVPGAGSGSGSGSGPGDGGGSGGGSGDGTGEGRGSGAGEGSGFVSSTADRREPVVIFKGNLEYPSSAVADGVEGVVKLSVLVSKRGTVEKVKVAESSRDRRLDLAALEFVRGWRYEPAVQDGEPRSVSTYAVVEFELK